MPHSSRKHAYRMLHIKWLYLQVKNGLHKRLHTVDKRGDHMSEIRLGAVESKFADIIWNNEPLRPVELEKLAEAELNWKRTTTLTILKRLCERGIFQNKDRIITSLISREEFYALQSEKFVNDTFEGSLPAFLTAFGSRKKLSDKEVEELKKVIDSMRR